MRATRLCCPLVLALLGCDPGSKGLPAEDLMAAAQDRVVLSGDQQAALTIRGDNNRIHSMLNIRKRLHYGEFVWDEKHAAPGKVWIRIDLGRQLMSVFRAGDEIGTAVILYGADAKPTPRGRFTILARFKDHRSTLYDAVMPYTLRLTGDGVSIHGSNVRQGAATHGCVGVPTGFAAHLFDVTRLGDPVLIVR